MKVKCLVWDLDNTLWHGLLPEGDAVTLRAGAAETVRALDARGILQSVASKNDPEAALRQLEEFGLAEYFLYPQIGWGSKAASLQAIQDRLNIGLDSMAFIDDQPFERDEVQFSLPEVFCLTAERLGDLLEMPEFQPEFITDDSRMRRRMYRDDMRRQAAGANFAGPRDDFLASLGMVFTLTEATDADLQRAEELTVRTNQLNTTGDTYGYDELAAFLRSDDHLLLMGELEDRFGRYGKVALALVACGAEAWRIKLLLASCRVMGCGVGTLLLHHVMRLAHDRGLPVQAEFRANGRNDMMRMTYRFAGFREVARDGERALLEARAERIPAPPPYVTIRASGRAQRFHSRKAVDLPGGTAP